MNCPSCGAPVPDDAKYCIYCKQSVRPDKFANPLEDGMVYCPFCAEHIPLEAVVCTHCGRQVKDLSGAGSQQSFSRNNNSFNNSNINSNNIHVDRSIHIDRSVHVSDPQRGVPVYASHKNMKNKWTAFFLCLFLGWIGAHKFYEGKAGMGLLYMFTFGLFGLGWIFDSLRYLTKPHYYSV